MVFERIRWRWLLGVMLASCLVSASWFCLRDYRQEIDLRQIYLAGWQQMVQTVMTMSQNQNPSFQPAALITPEMAVLRQYRYKWCGHVERGRAIKDPILVGLTAEQMNRLYPAAEGWEIVLEDPSRLVLSLNLEELCPVCVNKRHLGVVEGQVAVFIGPASFSGSMERLTDLKLVDLPPEWQELLLQGQIEFGDAETLSQVMDSLDEYR